MRAERDAVDFRDYRRWCSGIAERLFDLPEFRNARVVHTYVSSVNNEVDTLGVIYHLLDRDVVVVVPKCVPGTCRLTNQRIESLDELLPGRFGLMEPDGDPVREVPAARFDIVLAPLLAFDRNGGRLGFGGGYYDTLLGDCRCRAVGLAYSFQEVPAVPIAPHDRKLDIIVTETETIRTGHG